MKTKTNSLFRVILGIICVSMFLTITACNSAPNESAKASATGTTSGQISAEAYIDVNMRNESTSNPGVSSDTPKATEVKTSRTFGENGIYAAMLGEQDTDVFLDTARTIEVSEKEYNNESADKTKKIPLLFGGEEVIYKNSKKNELRNVDIYESENGMVSCRYNAETDQLTLISIDNSLLTIPDGNSTEDEYKSWVERLLKRYDVDNTSAYRYSCQTNTVVSNADSAYQEHYSYFYGNTKENESISSRTFDFTEYIGDYPTADRIHCNISINRTLIKFDENKFDDNVNIVIDENKIRETVNSFISESLNSEKYSVKSSDIIDENLTVIDNKVCLNVTVEAEFSAKSDNTSLVVLVNLAVFSD